MNLKMLMHHLSPNCQEAARLQSEAMDHELAWTMRVGLKLHVMICGMCRRYGRQLRFLREAIRNPSSPSLLAPSSQLSVEARERIKRALQQR